MKPTITKIKPSPSGRSCWLEFGDHKLFRLPLDWVVKKHLKVGLSLSSIGYKKILLKSIRYRLSEYVLTQVAISPKTEYLLRQKLTNYCHQHHLRAPLTINKVIKTLCQKSLLDQTTYLHYYLKRFPKKSTALLKFELRRRGVDRLLIDRLVKSDSHSQKNAIIAILEKRKITPTLWRDIREKNRTLGAILRKGFTLNEAKSAIDDYLNTRYNKTA